LLLVFAWHLFNAYRTHLKAFIVSPKISSTMSENQPLHHYLDASLISVQSPISSHKKLLQEMARLLSQALPESLEDNVEKEVYHALLEREKLGNTGIGNGVALPHSRLARADSAVIAIITLEEPVDYDSIDRQAVDVAFGLLVPQEATQEHLQILADIARMMSQESNRSELLKASTPQHTIDLITSWS